MSTTTTTTHTSPTPRTRANPDEGLRDAPPRVTPARVVRSEWVKFRTLTSSWLILGAAAASLVASAVVIGYTTGTSRAGLAPEDAAPSAVLQGYHLVTLLIGVLGVLFVTGEYGTGMVRSTLAAVPRRVPVLLAKTLVLGVTGLVAMVGASVAAYLSGQAVLGHYGYGTSLTASGVLSVVLGTGVYLALVGLLGSAIGWVVRNTAGGLSTFLGLLLILPLLIGFLPSSLSANISPYLPSTAGEAFISSVHAPGTLAPWTGLVVLMGWVVATLAVAAAQLRRRDA